jgi:hypothetical protein
MEKEAIATGKSHPKTVEKSASFTLLKRLKICMVARKVDAP